MKRRLAWSFASSKEEICSSEQKALLEQMGHIRCKEVKERFKQFPKDTEEMRAAAAAATAAATAAENGEHPA